jgi:hypothetical protein
VFILPPEFLSEHPPKLFVCWRCGRNEVDPADDFGACEGCKLVLRDPAYIAGRPPYEAPTDIPPS